MLKETNRLHDAKPLMQQALVIMIKSLGTKHPNSETVLENYNMLLQKLGLTDNEIQVSIRNAIGIYPQRKILTDFIW